MSENEYSVRVEEDENNPTKGIVVKFNPPEGMEGDIEVTNSGVLKDVYDRVDDIEDDRLNLTKLEEALSELGYLTKQDLADTFFRVGTILITEHNVNPSTYIGGEWELTAKDRTIIGAGDKYESGQTTGSETVTLIESQMPIHGHSVSITSSGATTTSNNGAHTHMPSSTDYNFFVRKSASGTTLQSSSGGSFTYGTNTATASGGAHTHSNPNHTHVVSQSNKGSGQAHNNMQPSVAKFIWRRIA